MTSRSDTNLQTRINDILSSHLSRFRCIWRDNGVWAEPDIRAVRRIIRLIELRGSGAVICWGYSLSVVPHISGTRLQYHKTFKAARPDVFEWPDSYNRSFSGSTEFERLSLSGEGLEKSWAQYMERLAPEIAEWYESVEGLPGVERELRRQIASPSWSYRLHHPSPAYVLPFVVAALGDMPQAKKLAASAFDENASVAAQLRLSLQRVPTLADIMSR